MKQMNIHGAKIHELNISPQQVAELILMVREGLISHQAARKIFPVLVERGGSPRDIAREMKLEQVSDLASLNVLVEEVMDRFPSMVEEFKGGKTSTLNALVGQVMKASRGKANPKRVKELLKKKIR
jgi:aspartyl-tRNA(Asn)/glutamyl-tRNA(Gln) amidotransferase subunit B